MRPTAALLSHQNILHYYYRISICVDLPMSITQVGVWPDQLNVKSALIPPEKDKRIEIVKPITDVFKGCMHTTPSSRLVKKTIN